MQARGSAQVTRTQPKSETRRPKAEYTATLAESEPIGSSHSRISGFGLLSGLGFRLSDFRAASVVSASTDRTRAALPPPRHTDLAAGDAELVEQLQFTPELLAGNLAAQ